mgnify:CR=1 FL=1
MKPETILPIALKQLRDCGDFLLPHDSFLTQVKLAGLFSTDDTIHPDTISRLIDTIHSLGHSCVVESVETEQQAAVLRTAGADLLQGWLYSRDLPADDLVTYLTESVDVGTTAG